MTMAGDLTQQQPEQYSIVDNGTDNGVVDTKETSEEKAMTSEDTSEGAVSIRQLAELAAAAAHRKSLDEGELLGHRAPVARHRSSGAYGLSVHRSGGSGLRVMSRTVANDPSRPSPRQRGVHRSASSDVSPMVGQHRSTTFGRTKLLRSDDATGEVVPNREVRRVKSSVGTSRAAPDRIGSLMRSDSAASARGVPPRRGVGRTCSQTSLKHMSHNGGEALAELGTLRRMDSGTPMSRSQQLSLLRRSVDDRSVGDLSNFTMATMDSVNLRKQQIVADPIDDTATYRETGSMADHESVSMATNDNFDYTEYLPDYNPNHVPYDGVSVADTLASDVDSYQNNQNNRLLPTRLLQDAQLLGLDEGSNHSRPDQIACDAVSLSTIGGEMDENFAEDISYFDSEEYAITLRQEIEAFEEGDDEDYEEESLRLLDGVKEQEEESIAS